MNNQDLSLFVFSFLKKADVQTVVVCAGARNAPLVLALEAQNFKIYSFFEERSAAFFALGLMKSVKKPVAVIVTSGTAVAELLPAAVEATFQGLPLILISADRPKSYRGTGSPQSIEQVGIFSSYVERVYDLDVRTSEFNFEWSRKKPIHLNVAFDEPLIDKRTLNVHEVVLQSPSNPTEKFKAVSSLKDPIIILGEFDKKYREKIMDFILKTRAPVYAESLSHLKNEEQLEPFLIKSSEQLIPQLFRQNLCGSVIRIGSVPTLRFWRDLETEFRDLPVLSFSDLNFSGLSRPSGLVSLESLSYTAEYPDRNLQMIRRRDEEIQTEKTLLFKKYPVSEQSLAHQLSLFIRSDAVYLGNSLPIRHWDQFAECSSGVLGANRGANGIDGQISTYLGWSENLANSYCFVGDLTALYDLAALALTPQLSDKKRNVVIMNNFGGQIFNRVFRNDSFINSHDTRFFNWAQMWKWNYFQITQAADFTELRRLITDKNVVEILPDKIQTQQFWQEWDQMWLKP